MAKAKEIYIDTLHLGYANKCEVSPEIKNSDPENTFDGPVPTGTDTVNWKVNIDKLRYGKVEDYKKTEALLLSMLKNPKTIKVVERAKGVDGTIRVDQYIYKCTLTDKKYTIDVEKSTVENLSFTGTSMKEWVNGEEIVY